MMASGTTATATTTSLVLLTAAVAAPPPVAAQPSDRFSNTILLAFMILLLPSIAILAGVAIWITRRIKAIASLDLEFAPSKWNQKSARDDPSSDTLMHPDARSPTLPTFANDTLGRGGTYDKVDLTNFSPAMTSTLRGTSQLSPSVRAALDDHHNNQEHDITDFTADHSSFTSPQYLSPRDKPPLPKSSTPVC